MMRYCKHCGSLQEEDVQVCGFCGAVLEVITPEPVPQEQPSETPASAPRKIPKKPLLIGGGILLAVVILAVAVYLLFFGHHYAVLKYESVMNGNYMLFESLAPKEYWEDAAAKKGLSIKEYLDQREESLEKTRKEYVKSMESDYGKNFSRSLQVVDSEEISEKELSSIKDSLQETYGIAPSRVKSARTLIVKFTLKGADKSHTDAGVLKAIQIDSQWYLFMVGQSMSGGTSIVFLTTGSLNPLLVY
jgi:hypothetical protein